MPLRKPSRSGELTKLERRASRCYWQRCPSQYPAVASSKYLTRSHPLPTLRFSPTCGYALYGCSPLAGFHCHGVSVGVHTANWSFGTDTAEVAAVFVIPAESVLMEESEAGLGGYECTLLEGVYQRRTVRCLSARKALCRSAGTGSRPCR